MYDVRLQDLIPWGAQGNIYGLSGSTAALKMLIALWCADTPLACTQYGACWAPIFTVKSWHFAIVSTCKMFMIFEDVLSAHLRRSFAGWGVAECLHRCSAYPHQMNAWREVWGQRISLCTMRRSTSGQSAFWPTSCWQADRPLRWRTCTIWSRENVGRYWEAVGQLFDLLHWLWCRPT